MKSYHIIAAALALLVLASCAQEARRGPVHDTSAHTGSATDSLGTGTATLSWIPPTTKEDGTPLMELTGYRIRFGPEADRYRHTAELNDPKQTRYTLHNLAPGTYYFTITAVDKSGNESAFSKSVRKEIK